MRGGACESLVWPGISCEWISSCCAGQSKSDAAVCERSGAAPPLWQSRLCCALAVATVGNLSRLQRRKVPPVCAGNFHPLFRPPPSVNPRNAHGTCAMHMHACSPPGFHCKSPRLCGTNATLCANSVRVTRDRQRVPQDNPKRYPFAGPSCIGRGREPGREQSRHWRRSQQQDPPAFGSVLTPVGGDYPTLLSPSPSSWSQTSEPRRIQQIECPSTTHRLIVAASTLYGGPLAPDQLGRSPELCLGGAESIQSL